MNTWGESLQEAITETTAILDQTQTELEDLIRQMDDICSTPLPDKAEIWRTLRERLQLLAQRCATDSQHLMLSAAETQRNELRIPLIQSQEEERQRIARELQEGLGQLLANAVLELESCDHLLDKEPALVHKGLRLLKTELRAGLETMQNLVTELQPPLLLSELGLAASLEHYLQQFQNASGLEVHAHLDSLTVRLPPTMEITIFRIIQEALRNIRQHAKASQVTVDVEAGSETLVFVVEDNGQGFSWHALEEPGKHHWGLIGMRDRALFLGGSLRVFNKGDGGTRVVLTVPYPISAALPSAREAQTLSMGGESE